MMASSSSRQPSPLLWLAVPPTGRQVLEAHLRHVSGRFRAAGWEVVRGLDQPQPNGVLAVQSDPFAEPLPEVLAAMATAPGGHGPAWRLPQVSNGQGPQRWPTPRGPYTLSSYRRQAVGTRPSGRTVVGSEAWTGLAVASATDATELLERGWPPRAGDRLLLVGARVFRYEDPAAHPRPELDPFVPEEAQLIVDVGCGSGLVGGRQRRRGRLVVGIEPDRTLAREAAMRLDLVLIADAVNGLAALARPADCILLGDVLEHTADPASTLAEVAAALSRGGVAVVSLPNAAWVPLLADLLAGRWDVTLAGPQARDHLAVMTPASFRELAAEADLITVEEAYLPAPLPLGDRLRAAWLATTRGLPWRSLVSPQWISVLRRR